MDVMEAEKRQIREGHMIQNRFNENLLAYGL